MDESANSMPTNLLPMGVTYYRQRSTSLINQATLGCWVVGYKKLLKPDLSESANGACEARPDGD